MSGRLRHASTDANAFSFRLERAAAETPGPQMISKTPSIRLVETPARCISIIVSPVLVSRLRQR